MGRKREIVAGSWISETQSGLTSATIRDYLDNFRTASQLGRLVQFCETGNGGPPSGIGVLWHNDSINWKLLTRDGQRVHRDVYDFVMGNVQRLDNGGFHIEGLPDEAPPEKKPAKGFRDKDILIDGVQ